MKTVLLLAAAGCISASIAMAQSGEARRALTQVTDDVWRFDNNFHASMVVVTEAGAVVGDPINAQMARAGVKGQGFVDPLTQQFRITFAAKLSPNLGRLDPACKVNDRLTSIQ